MIWGVLAVVAYGSQRAEGGSWSLVMTGTQAILTGLVFLLAIRQLFMLAQDGKTDAKGRPRPLDAAVVAREFSDTFRFTSPPQLVQRLLFGLLAPIARATGRSLPVLESLPASPAAPQEPSSGWSRAACR